MMSKIGGESRLLAKHSVIYGLGNFLNRAAAFLLLPIYTRFLTPTEYGIKELVGLSTEVAAVAISSSFVSAIYRFYFEYESKKDRNEVLSTAIIAVGLIGLAGVGVLSLMTKTMASYILDSPSLYYYFILSFCSLWFQSLNEIGNGYLRLEKKSLKYIMLSTGKLVLMIMLNIYFVAILRIGILGIFISTLLASASLSLVLIVPIIFRIGFAVSLNKLKEMVRFGLPLIPSQLGGLVVRLSDRFFIKGFCSIGDAGIYSLSYRFGTLPSHFISAPFNQIWLPRRFEIYKEEGSEELFGRIFTYFLAFLIFAGLAVSVLTKEVIQIMADKSFWSAWQIVPIIVLADVIFSLHYHLNMGILIEKKTKYLAFINVSNGILVLLLNFILIRQYGVYGAAIVTLIAYVYKVGLTYYFSSRYYKIHFEFFRIAKLILCAALLYGVCTMVAIESVYLSFVLKSGIICLFPGLLLIAGFFSAQEKRKAIQMMGKLVPGI